MDKQTETTIYHVAPDVPKNGQQVIVAFGSGRDIQYRMATYRASNGAFEIDNGPYSPSGLYSRSGVGGNANHVYGWCDVPEFSFDGDDA